MAEVPVPVLRDGDILIKMAACGVCGTDLMKVYDGSVEKPVQLGHEIVGTVEAVGPGVSGLRTGTRVAAAHHAPDFSSHYSQRGSDTQDPVFKASNVDPGGFAELIRVPAQLVPHTVLPVPTGIPTLRATFMEPLACCIRALERVPVKSGDTVLVIGVGAIGLLFVPLIRSKDANVLAADINPDRLAAAAEWGASGTFVVGKDDIPAASKQQSGGRGVDVVVLTATNPATLELALDSVRDGGTIIPFGVKPGMSPAFDFWRIYRREISIVTSYSATPAGLAEAMRILSQPGFELEKTISQVVPLADASRGFELLHKGLTTKVIVTAD